MNLIPLLRIGRAGRPDPPRSLSAILLIALTLSLPSFSTAQTPKKKKPALPDGVEKFADIPYAEPGGKPLLLDLYLPRKTGDKPLPVVVFVHGGGWKNGSKERCKATWLTAQGFAVASINYRLTDVAIWPAQLDDCRAAVRWLRENADAHGLDPDHIGAWGTSAGGHLAALMGTKDAAPEDRIQAVCDWFGPTELLTMPPNTIGNGRTAEDVANSNGAKLLGGSVPENPELAKDASAIEHVSRDDPPFLIMHGEKDPGVPLAQSTKFHARLQEAGVESELRIVKGAGHGGPEFETDAERAAVLAFFQKHL